MFTNKKLSLLVPILLVTLLSSVTQAAGTRVRGEISEIENNIATITNSAGQKSKVAIAKDYVVLVYKDIEIDSIPLNAYVGIPSVPTSDGMQKALGLIVFPEAMRGLNEGFADWDLTADSKMTNGTVAQFVSRAGERVLNINYGDEKKTVFVPEGIQTSTFSADPSRKIKIGDKVVIFADNSQGLLKGKYIGIHANGSLPPL